MYESFYGLTRRPFAATPDPDCFVPVETIQHALTELLLCVHTGQGVGVLTAPAGTGKTLLCRRIEQELADAFHTVVIPSANFPTRRSLLQAILYELGHPYIRMAEQELRLELVTAARQAHSENKGVAILLDEAHLLSDRLLEEVRAITNLSEAGEPLVRVVLAGQLVLEERLAAPALEALNQRIGCHVSLESLTKAESAEYLRARLAWAGGPLDATFTREAVQLICHCADGLPRCLNHLADHSLLLGYVNEEKPVSAATVREALLDLKQLPLHWNEPTAIPSPAAQLSSQVRSEVPVPAAGSSIEFAGDDAEPESAAVEFGSDDEFVAIEVGADEEFASVTSHSEISSAPSETGWRGQEPQAHGPAERFETASSQETSETFDATDAASEGFEEELIEDRYAALDARGPFGAPGLNRTGSPHGGRSTTSRNDRPADEASFDLDEALGNSHRQTACEETIDEVLPLLRDAIESDDTAFKSTAASTPAIPRQPATAAWEAPMADAHPAWETEEEPLEEEIGAAVLEACLEVQRAIGDRIDDLPADDLSQFDAVDDAAEMELDDLDEQRFDVVHPEDLAGGRGHENRVPEAARRTRQYEQLFSALRRRHRRGA